MKKRLFTILLLSAISLSTTVKAQFWTESIPEPSASQLSMADDGTVYFLAMNNSMLKSEDDGNVNTWDPVLGFPNENSYKMFTKGNDLFLMNYESVIPPATPSYQARGVLKSNDGGQSWTQKNNGLGGDTNVVTMYSLSDDVLIIQTRSDQNTHNIYRSTNNGDTWNFVQSIDGYARSVTKRANGDWLLCSGPKLYKSIDNGLSWSELHTTLSSGYHDVVELDNGNLMLFTLFEILESSDGGGTFTTKSTNGLPDLSTQSNVVYPHGEFFNDVIYVSFNNNHGIFKSEDNGDNWTNIDHNLPLGLVLPTYLGLSKNGYLFASVSGEGIFRSTEPVTGSVVSVGNDMDVSKEISIFPNPTEDLITISLDGINNNFEVEVRDLQGKLVSSTSSKENAQDQIEIQGDPGIYLVKVYNENFSYTEKVVKR